MILQAVGSGVEDREALKDHCQRHGMTETEGKSLFDPWGGLIRALCERGQLCHKVQDKKAYTLCPPFTPMAEAPARLELARRYFTHFGPATIKDAAYFFGKPQSQVKSWLAQLPVTQTALDGQDYFYIDRGLAAGEIPPCLFLAGFDQLMLGYEKKESLFLPQAHTRQVFTLAGIVRPALLVDGTVAGWWNRKNQTLAITLFTPVEKPRISDAAMAQWPGLKKIEYV